MRSELSHYQGYEDGKAGAPPISPKCRIKGAANYRRGWMEGRRMKDRLAELKEALAEAQRNGAASPSAG